MQSVPGVKFKENGGLQEEVSVLRRNCKRRDVLPARSAAVKEWFDATLNPFHQKFFTHHSTEDFPPVLEIRDGHASVEWFNRINV